ncbi:Hypothetical predicted protein [Paramuricea clavata]|uniref:Uncharacterized protein n=1 Tax=Paramuricea clavata TaxID=317549 RepID=A0A7D9EH12_PARCT|nr:Hypothetical predicted protein [Paramuricea clavata]
MTSKTNKFTYDAEVYHWISSLSELKCFFENNFNLQGIWNSPGGNMKLFCTAKNEFIIKWYGLWLQKLAIQADNDDQFLKQKFENLANASHINKTTQLPIYLSTAVGEEASVDKENQSVHEEMSKDKTNVAAN